MAARLTALRPPGRLLDVGGGAGDFGGAAAKVGWRAVATDLSHEACVVARARTGRPVLQGDGASLPIRDGAVDGIALLNVVDHTTDPLAVLREARRALAPGGALVIRVTNGHFHGAMARMLTSAPWLWRVIPLAPVLHLWSFTPRGLRALVERAGLDVVAVVNSSLTAESDERSGQGALSVVVPRTLLAAGVGLLGRLSGGRWLLAPALELYARRPAAR